MKTIDNVNFDSERVIIRVDYNVPFEGKRITDITRIEASKETIDLVLKKGGSIILLTHIGRPNGHEPEFSCQLLINEVTKILGREVFFCNSTIGKDAEEKCKMLKSGEIMLMENVRFFKEETKGDQAFAKSLSKLGTVFINDAFGTAHRAHSSTTLIAKFFKKKYYGKLLEK